MILKGKSVLLVEDIEMNNLLAYLLLKRTGGDITQVETGIDAVEQLKNRQFDLIFLDLYLPVLDGFAVAGIIRKKLNSSIPIIAFGTNMGFSQKQECANVGINYFLLKPFTEAELHLAIKTSQTFNIIKSNN